MTPLDAVVEERTERVSAQSVIPKPSCAYCGAATASSTIRFCRSCELKLPNCRAPSILLGPVAKANETVAEVSLYECLAHLARADGNERAALLHDHSARLAQWRRTQRAMTEGTAKPKPVTPAEALNELSLELTKLAASTEATPVRDRLLELARRAGRAIRS